MKLVLGMLQHPFRRELQMPIDVSVQKLEFGAFVANGAFHGISVTMSLQQREFGNGSPVLVYVGTSMLRVWFWGILNYRIGI